MKKIIKLLVSGILGFLGGSFLLSGVMGKIVSLVVIGIVILLVAVKLSGLLPSDKRKEQEKLEELRILKEAGHLETIVLTHEAGLPIAEGALCSIHYYKDNIKIQSSGADFNLATNKIMDMNIKTTTEIERFYNSSIGGAVAGAFVFGPIGAMIGGRKKKKEIKKIENFLVITYDKDDEINFLVFNTDKAPFEANKIVKIFKESGIKSQKIIDL